MNGSPIRQPLGFAAALLFALLLLLPACGGGSSAPDPDPDPDPDPTPAVLTVLDVFPKNLSARSGSTIRFIAQTSAQASSYAWDFGLGATPSTSTEFQPLVILGDPGTYSGSLTVCAATCSEPFAFTYTVEPISAVPPALRILAIRPDGNAGNRGDTVSFSAELQGLADIWEWEFDGGTSLSSSAEPTPSVLFIREGTFNGRLHVRLSGGDEDTLPFAYHIGPGTINAPPVIESLDFPYQACDNKTLQFQAELISDFPVQYSWEFSAGITPTISSNSVARFTSPRTPGRYQLTLRASNEHGTSEGKIDDFEIFECPDARPTLVVDPTLPLGVVRVDLQVDGPVFSPQDNELAPEDAPLLYSDWPDNTRFYFASPRTTPLELTFRASRFESWGAGDDGHLTLPTADLPPEPVARKCFDLPVSVGEGFYPAALGLRGDRLCLVYGTSKSSPVMYAEAVVPDPQDTDDWAIHEVPARIEVDSSYARTLLTFAGGRPAVYVYGNSTYVSNAAGRELEYLLIADVMAPAMTADWSLIPLKTSTNSRANRVATFLADGRLAIVDKTQNEWFRLRLAKTAMPQLEDDFVWVPLNLEALPGDDHQVQPPLEWQGHILIPVGLRSPETGSPNQNAVLVSATGTPTQGPDFARVIFPPLFPIRANSFYDFSFYRTEHDLWLHQKWHELDQWRYRTRVANPSSLADWEPVEPLPLFRDSHSNVAAALVDDRLLFVGIQGLGTIWRALIPSPVAAADWQVSPLLNSEGASIRPIVIDQCVDPSTDQYYFAGTELFDNDSVEVWRVDLQ